MARAEKGEMMRTAESGRRHDLATSRRSRSRGVVAVVLACVLAGGLLIALTGGPASAASRGFTVNNKSNKSLKLFAVQRVPTFICVNPGACARTTHPMDFEGRPQEGAVLDPNRSQRFELKYGFSILGGVQYAANLWYKIQGDDDPDDNVYYTIEVYSTTNESYCNINKTSKYECKAEGTQLTFKNK
jgi:hypothetical protein